MVTLGDWKYCTPASVLKKAFYIFRPNNTWSGISTCVCSINVTVAAGMKPNHLFKNITVKNTNRSVRSTITTKLKQELKSPVADQHWKSSPTPMPLRGADTQLSFRPWSPARPPPPCQHHNILLGWLVESYAEYPFFGMQEGQTSIEMLCFWESKKTLWMKQRKNLRYKYLQSRFMLQVPPVTLFGFNAAKVLKKNTNRYYCMAFWS